jgi:hypothetical protein
MFHYTSKVYFMLVTMTALKNQKLQNEWPPYMQAQVAVGILKKTDWKENCVSTCWTSVWVWMRKRNYRCKWDGKKNIRTNVGHGQRTACVLHRLSEGIWPCKLDQINADPKEHWYEMMWKKIHQKTGRGSARWSTNGPRRHKECEGWRGELRQGCLPQILFNLNSEYLSKEALEGFGDFKIAGQVWNMQLPLCYWLRKKL